MGKIRETNFSKITSVDDMVAYLNDSAKRLEKRNSIYHYTNLDRVVDIFKSELWHLGNASCMNDVLEFNNGDPERWKNIFFASFMTDVKENIGMWSMYAQPWIDGVLIEMPKKVFREWISGTKEILEVSCKDFQLTGKSVNVDDENKLFLSSVAYSNCDNVEFEEKTTCGSATNNYFNAVSHIPELTGYIKDSAWDYEREIRIKATLAEGHGFQRVAIQVPQEVLNSMTIVAGPLFEGKLENRLKEEILAKTKVSNSIYRDKLKFERDCSNCTIYRKGMLKNEPEKNR